MERLLRRLQYWLRQRRAASELAEELEAHRALKQSELEARGLTAADAAAESRRAMGNMTLAREDASAMSLPDRSVDLSFHNGFWAYFSDDARLLALLREQARVTRRVLAALVHNADNPRVVAAFARKAKTDPLYDIRFFRAAELAPLVQAAGLAPRTLGIEKFGGPVDRLLALHGVFGRLARAIVPRLYRFLPWSQVERIALVLEL